MAIMDPAEVILATCSREAKGSPFLAPGSVIKSGLESCLDEGISPSSDSLKVSILGASGWGLTLHYSGLYRHTRALSTLHT